MNPMQLLNGMKNPQQFLRNIMGNNQIMGNPMARNAVDMMQKGNVSGIERMARNLCKEKGLDPDDVMKQMKNKFGM